MPAEATETALAPIAVSVRTRLATAKVDWNRRLSSARRAARLLRRAVGILELAEDLRLAEDHRIEPGGDGIRVPHGIRVLDAVQAICERPVAARLGDEPVGERHGAFARTQ